MRGMIPEVFGIPIEGGDWSEIEREREAMQNRPYWIVTANPEILLEARRDATYAETVRQADYRTVDGVGLWAVLRVRGYRTTRYTGMAFAERLMEQAATRGERVGMVGGSFGVADRAATAMRTRYPSLVVHAEAGGRVDRDGSDDLAGEEARHRLGLFAPDVLLVAFGHPKQERWIQRYLHEFPSVKVVVGVGGTLDVWAGAIPRAPRWMQRVGIEWVWRLIQEPRRIGRIWRAVVVFPLRALFSDKKIPSKTRG